jgi:hypothetical protein
MTTHPSDPYLDLPDLGDLPPDPYPDTAPTERVTVGPRPRRTGRRPSVRYESPEELWRWHWARMRIFACWSVLIPVALILGITLVTFFVELT